MPKSLPTRRPVSENTGNNPSGTMAEVSDMSTFLVKTLESLRREYGSAQGELGDEYKLEYVQRHWSSASNWAVFTRWPTKPEVSRWAAFYAIIIALMGSGSYWIANQFAGTGATFTLLGAEVVVGENPWTAVFAVAGSFAVSALIFFPYRIRHSMGFDSELANTFAAMLQLAQTDEQKAMVSDLVRRHHNLQTNIKTAGRQPGYSFEGHRRDAIELEVKALEEQRLEMVGQAEEKHRELLQGTWAAGSLPAE